MRRVSAIRLLPGILLLSFCIGETVTANDSFTRAYQREFAFLEAEKRELAGKLKSMEVEAASREKEAMAEISAMQHQLLSLHKEADALEYDLENAERDNTSLDENRDMIMDTIQRANESLQRYGFDLSSPSENVEVQATQIRSMLVAVETAMNSGWEIIQEQGDFFLLNGKKTSGDILRIGHVAAYGVSGQGSGALAPAGANRLKLWDRSTSGVAETILKNRSIPELSLFLFESLEKAVDPREEKGWIDTIRSGGVIAWIIVALGCLGVLLILLRILILIRAGRRTDYLIHEVGELVDRGNFDGAKQLLKKSSGAAGHVLMATISNLHKEREKLDDIVSEAILHQTPHIERFGSAILVIASVGPLLGLLGTVTGMISTFDVITEFGTGDPKMLSGGISEALVTTKLGLIVAIPMLLIGTLLSGRASSILDAMERAALQIINKADLREGRLSSDSETTEKVRTDAAAETATEAG